MFTGIIEEVGRVAAVTDLGGARRLKIRSELSAELRVDQSISVNGVCQTVVRCDDSTFDVVAVEETLSKTTLGSFSAEHPVNLERAAPVNRRLDGHIVQGHVDATGEIISVESKTGSWIYRIAFDPGFAALVIPTGSISLDGISLTTARVAATDVTVAIIPYTYEHTNIRNWQVGEAVNIEFDMIGKYVVRWLETQRRKNTPGITREWLEAQGF